MAFGSFESRPGGQPMAEINTTPLVDVMLVLLVIFIITAPLITQAIRLDLPDAKAPVLADPGEAITVSLDAQGNLYWNNEALADSKEFERRLARLAADRPNSAINLRADRDTRYERIAEVLSTSQQAGITRLGFVTESPSTR
jgi:biopolymer transport protein ExbD